MKKILQLCCTIEAHVLELWRTTENTEKIENDVKNDIKFSHFPSCLEFISCCTLPLSFYLNLDYEVFGSNILFLQLAKLESGSQIYFRHFLIVKTSPFSVLLFQNFQQGNIFLPAVLFIMFVTFRSFILETLHFFQVVWDVLCLEVCHSEGQRLSLSVWLGRPSVVIRLLMLPRWGTSGLAGK